MFESMRRTRKEIAFNKVWPSLKVGSGEVKKGEKRQRNKKRKERKLKTKGGEEGGKEGRLGIRGRKEGLKKEKTKE